MPFVTFDAFFLELARQETRSVLTYEDGVVTRAHFFRELFCDEPGCDCRRVMFHVVSDEPGASQPRATLSWGWEPDQFYRDWARFPLDEDDLEELRGPALVRLTHQSEEADALLEQLRMLLRDPGYRARIQRHYRMVREHVDSAPRAPGPVEHAPSTLNRAERRRLAREQRRR